MEIETTTVARQYRLMEWADQIRDCQSRPNGMSVDEAFTFYDNSILPGTKIFSAFHRTAIRFYDNSILPGTKMVSEIANDCMGFYDNSILPGTKIQSQRY